MCVCFLFVAKIYAHCTAKDRIAGATTEINALKDAYNKGEYPIRERTDVHALCDLVKSWFRVLPEPVFPPSSYHDVMEAMSKLILCILVLWLTRF